MYTNDLMFTDALLKEMYRISDERRRQDPERYEEMLEESWQIELAEVEDKYDE